MTKRLLPILLLCVLLASCFKYITVDNSIKYTVGGFHDLTIDQNDSCMLSVYVELLSGDPANEYITAKVSGIPDNVSVNNDSLTFRPNYGFPLVFYAHSPKPGVYPVSVTTNSPTMGTKVYTFNLTVTSLTDCTLQFSRSQVLYSTDNQHGAQMAGRTGAFYAFVTRTGCDTIYMNVVKDSMAPYDPDPTLYTEVAFKAFVNCPANTLTIYPQTAQWLAPTNEMIRGSGSFVPLSDTTATTTITDTVYSGSQVISVNTITIY